MFYTIYKTTNILNGKYYIGKHKTGKLDDGYLGSGTLLKRSIAKYGRSAFRKDILFVFDNEQEMNAKEAEIVSELFIQSDDTYNLKVGGEGGWDYNNVVNPHSRDRCGIALQDMYRNNPILDKQRRDNLSDYMSNLEGLDDRIRKMNKVIKSKYPEGVWKGKRHKEESKKKIGDKSKIHQKGSGNSMYGTKWIYSLEEKVSKRIDKESEVPEGWNIGRKIKFD